MLKRNRGFTLLEMLVALAIMAIIAVLIFANYRQGQKNYVLTQVAQRFVGDIREAQNMAVTGAEVTGYSEIGGFVTRGKDMGLGDVKMAFLMGLVLSWPLILPALLSAFIFGALVGLGLIAAGRAKMKSEIPFGTFLAAATFLALVFGNAIPWSMWLWIS